MYIWIDASGQVRMTDDLSQVPPSHRVQAEQAARRASATRFEPEADSVDAVRLKVLEAGANPETHPERNSGGRNPGSGRAHRAAVPRDPGAEVVQSYFADPEGTEGRRHVLRVEQVGSSMRVRAIVDGVEIPFVLDTGATTCTMPRWAAEEMGLTIDEETPRVPVSGISGKVLWVPELRVDSVTVGDARVENLHMTVLDTMEEGLLGMPFFNHFRVSTDPVAGTLVLEEIDLDSVPGVVGGLNERAWRQKFWQRRFALAKVREQLARLPYEYVTIRERLEKQERYWEEQLELLDLEASQMGVPQNWRE